MEEMSLLESICSAKHYRPESFVYGAFEKLIPSDGVLDLSGYSFNESLCEIIAEYIRKSNKVKVLNLADCMISPDGLKRIIESLAHDHRVIEVNLYGNNISSESTQILGKLLSTNSSLKKLNLNWNYLGQSEEDFALFCDGLSKNMALESLDLRNNQLCSKCGRHLSSALMSNRSLKELDLRWNKLQDEGIELIQSAILSNDSLSSINLKGNLANFKIVSNTEQQAKHNEEVISMKYSYESKIAILLTDLKTMEQNKMEGISTIIDKENKKLIAMETKLEKTVDKLISKEMNLKREKSSKAEIAIEALLEKEEKLKIMEELEIVKRENSELKKFIEQKEIELRELSMKHQKSLDLERELSVDVTRDMKDMNLTIERLNKKLDNQQSLLEMAFKKEIENLGVSWRSKLALAEEKSEMDIKNVKEALVKEQNEELKEKNRELELLKTKIKEESSKNKELEQKAANCEKKVDYLSKEISFLRGKLSSTFEEVESLKKDLKNEKLKHKMTRESLKTRTSEVKELDVIISHLKNNFSTEKISLFNLSRELGQTNCLLTIERDEEKLRREFLTSALKKICERWEQG